MSQFERRDRAAENNFVRHSPEILNSIYGTSNVTPFWIADMDFVVAEPIRKELQRLADRAQFSYEFDPERVFAAISNWHRRRHKLKLHTDRFVQVPSVLTGIALLLRELTEKGEGVLVQSPVYHQFYKAINSADRRVVTNPLWAANGRYEMDLEDLEEKLSADDVNVMILCSPHNPVGRVWTKDELEALLDIAGRHGVTIISDEVHSDIVYSGYSFTGLTALDSGKHVALIGSPAKTFGMHSIANGYIYTENPALFEAVRNTAESLYLVYGNAFSTYATIAAYENGGAWLDELLLYLKSTIEWIEHFLETELPVVSMFPVEGTYQIWFDFSATGLSGDELIQTFARAEVGFSPGTWFDRDAITFARMNIAAPRADIQDAFKRLKAEIG